MDGYENAVLCQRLIIGRQRKRRRCYEIRRSTVTRAHDITLAVPLAALSADRIHDGLVQLVDAVDDFLTLFTGRSDPPLIRGSDCTRLVHRFENQMLVIIGETLSDL